MHNVNLLAHVLGPDMRHNVRCLFASKVAIRALKSWLLSAFILQMTRHVAFDGKAPRALGTAIRFVLWVRYDDDGFLLSVKIFGDGRGVCRIRGVFGTVEFDGVIGRLLT